MKMKSAGAVFAAGWGGVDAAVAAVAVAIFAG